MNTPRACDFCGRSAPEVSLSKEHVFARSLRDTVRHAEDHTYASATDKSGQLKGGKAVRPVAMFDITSRRVCRECNSGWMSELEVAANPVLRRLISGEATLTGAEVDVVRRWLVKTAVVDHMAEPNSEKPTPTVDPRDRRTVMDQIPGGWVVTLAVLHSSWRNHTHRGSVALPKVRMVDGVEISERFHFATIEIGCMLGTVTGFGRDSDVGAAVVEWITSGMITSYPSMSRLERDEAIELPPAWNPPSVDAIDNLGVQFAGSMSDLGS
ncbi:Shikimate kinase [Rhodococcus sp. AW25M09]|uniref:hypothetical protein n=1 Tax=Rhodococcus sp. AW25M09 TaxID=1268303 RepID=UPI0002AC9AF4|nr:hypothetical protein [Rhodococcus sp. AW25M09]CCQ18112.1 Shikimate kinase [Rhodococcus sp. AW25M09]